MVSPSAFVELSASYRQHPAVHPEPPEERDQTKSRWRVRPLVRVKFCQDLGVRLFQEVEQLLWRSLPQLVLRRL